MCVRAFLQNNKQTQTLISCERRLNDLSFRKRFNFISCTITRESFFKYILPGKMSANNVKYLLFYLNANVLGSLYQNFKNPIIYFIS